MTSKQRTLEQIHDEIGRETLQAYGECALASDRFATRMGELFDEALAVREKMSLPEQARQILEQKAKIPPEQRFKEMIRSGLINEEGNLTLYLTPLGTAVLIMQRLVQHVGPCEARTQALEFLKKYETTVEGDAG